MFQSLNKAHLRTGLVGGKTTKNILELAKDLEGLCCSLYLQMSELVQTHYFLGKTTKNRLELAKDLEGLTGNS